MHIAPPAADTVAGDLDRRGFTGSAHLLAGTPVTVRLHDNRSVRLRVAESTDAGELSAMHARSSTRSMYARYGMVPPMTGRFLSRLLNGDTAIVAEAPNHSLVAIGNLGRDDDGTGEVAVLVEDAWQGAGLGSAALGHLVTIARLVGYAEVRTRGAAEPQWCLPTLSRFGTPRLAAGVAHLPLRRASGYPPRLHIVA